MKRYIVLFSLMVAVFSFAAAQAAEPTGSMRGHHHHHGHGHGHHGHHGAGHQHGGHGAGHGHR